MLNADSDDTKDILEFSRDGSQKAFETFVARHHKALYQLCYFILDDQGLAHKASKKVFVAVLRESYRYTQSTPFQPWFNTLVTRVLSSQIGQALHRMRLQKTTLKPEQGLFLSLSGEAAHALARHSLDGLDPAKLAQVFACPPGQMRSRLKRAIQDLTLVLRERLDLEDDSVDLRQRTLTAIEEIKTRTQQVEIPETPQFEKLERDATRQTTSILIARARFPLN